MGEVTDKLKTIIDSITEISIFGVGVKWEQRKVTETASSSEVPLLPEQLLTFIWDYPLGPGNQASWAVREIALLRGEFNLAREQPSLGIAIASTEFTSGVFGETANSRIDICIQWAMARTDPKPPHYFLVEVTHPPIWHVTKEPDFRHTLALAIILARNNRHPKRLEGYVDIVLESQREDGGWAPGGNTEASEMFTVLYAIELLHECANLSDLSDNRRIACAKARDRALRWLMDNRTSTGLWVGGVLSEYAWEGLHTTSWVLDRLCRLNDVIVAGWRDCFIDGLSTMIREASGPSPWRGTDPHRRNMVEARVAASVRNARAFWSLRDDPRHLADSYLEGWERQARGWLSSLSISEIDLATAVFLLEGLFEHQVLVEHRKELLKSTQ
ncbi:MAG: hypothetical protein KJO08_03590 [Gammaproteobacteria bacterium]|nr:hypothetical protein [Gammaproteobacteria bacterium]